MMPKRLLAREQRLRANGLLDMLYTPAELADELGIDQRDVYYRLMPAGLPHTKDSTGHIWLHGPRVAQWVRELGKAHQRALGDNEAYCLRCRQIVALTKTKRVRQGKFLVLQATCPQCGATVNRGVKKR